MNTRKDNNGKALKAWRALGIGHIAKPLRHIANRTNGRDAKGNVVLSPQYLGAFAASQAGDGLFVQTMARSLR